MDMHVVLSPRGMNIHLRYLREMPTKFYLGNLREETTLKVPGRMGV